jgi:hypothetical protein
MRRFLLVMHDDTTEAEAAEAWGPYLADLTASGRFEGGSSIGSVVASRRSGEPVVRESSAVGYLVVQADDVDDARSFLVDNPVYVSCGTVEICELVGD